MAPALERAVRVPALWSAAVGAAALVLYLALAPPVSGDGDASELTLALALGGVPHPTGYPLYAMIGHLFALVVHRLGASWSYAANAWSAVGGGVAIAFLHAVAARLVPREAKLGRWGRFAWALLPAALFALDPVWTMSTALAEIHSWHVAWVGGITLLFLVLVNRGGGGARGAAAWGFAVGLGLAHHATAALVALPLTVALAIAWRRAGRPLLRALAIVAIAAALPLVSYAFVAWRAFHPAPYQWPLLAPSWEGVRRHVLAGAYGHFLGTFAPSDLQRGFLAAYVYPFLWPAALATLIVAARARRAPDRVFWWGVLAATIVQLVYVFQYGVPDPAAYFLPPLFLALLAVPALLALAPRGAIRRVLAGLATLGLLLLAVPWLRVALDRRAGFVEVDEHLRHLWTTLPFERGIVLWPSDMHTRFLEYQLFEHSKPEVFVSSPNLLTFDRPRADFQRRFGVDPLAGIEIRGDEDVARIPANVSRQTALPVAEVDALGITLQVLPKR